MSLIILLISPPITINPHPFYYPQVCLARALYREELAGGVLLMDEVTASLDAQTESLVTDAVISRVDQGATAILHIG